VWDIPNVKANHPEKTGHPAQFPVELVERCVLALTRPGDLVLDPFLGVGSSAIGSLRHDRRFLGFELDPAYVEVTKDRIERLRLGSLPLRPLGRPVHVPTGREKVAQVPAEWSSNGSEPE
jgi:DNA modification methylase